MAMAKKLRSSTAQDVAKAAGVSQATVSYILSGRRTGALRISEPTRERVLAAATALEYVPNQTARGLRRRQLERICVVLPDLAAPTSNALVRDIQREATLHGYTVVVTMAETAAQERTVLRQLRAGLADGAIFISPRLLDAEEFVAASEHLALVLMSNHVHDPALDIVRTMGRHACREAVNYLLDREHQRIGFIGICGNELDREERLTGYTQAIEQRGLLVDNRLIQGVGTSREQAYCAAETLMGLEEPPSAIFAASDLAAISAIWAARDAGRRVPEDIAIIGVGNVPEGLIMRPPLTTVGPSDLDFRFIGQLLFSRLHGEAPREGRVVDHRSTLILRGSA
jgi:DNA-binding LacI/PurR family transcriptional regulator